MDLLETALVVNLKISDDELTVQDATTYLEKCSSVCAEIDNAIKCTVEWVRSPGDVCCVLTAGENNPTRKYLLDEDKSGKLTFALSFVAPFLTDQMMACGDSGSTFNPRLMPMT